MKRSLLVIVSILICMFSDAQTHKKGLIYDETWTKSNSPYIIDSAILVALLTIEPGVEVRFSGNYVFEVSGILTAIGWPCDTIKFTSVLPLTWQGMSFQNSVSGTVMELCVIENANTSGIRISESFPKISNCIFRNNTSSNSGGGLRISNTSTGLLDINNCIIERNSTSVSNGGGVWIYAANGTVRLTNCVIANNQCRRSPGYSYGGGAFVDGNAEFILCNINDNLAGGYAVPLGNSAGIGGGIYIGAGTVKISNTIINNNIAEATDTYATAQSFAYGGGVDVNGGQVAFLNSIITNNIVRGGNDATQGSGLFNNSGQTTIENCVFASNNIHAIHNNASAINVLNSILFFNNNSGAQVTGNVNITFSNVQGGYPGAGNININPVFQGAGSYKIVFPSPSIDAGNPGQQYQDVCFPPSLGGATNDMGAYGGPQACKWNDIPRVADCRPLPVSWLYFKAQVQDKIIELNWATASEQNSKNFIVERSLDGRGFSDLALIPAKGSSNQIEAYSYQDINNLPLNSSTLFYRLKQVDMDGNFNYSKIIKLDIFNKRPFVVKPNPASEKIIIELNEIASNTDASLFITNMEGRKLITQKIQLKPGHNSIQVIIGSLSKGVYIAVIESSGNKWQTRFIKQ